MRSGAMRSTGYNARGRHERRGFTLVELIVVLTILAILAAVGVASVVGYINRSRLDKNNQTAITVFQAAQSALTAKTSGGVIDSWVRGIPGLDVASDSDLSTSADDATNYSRHKTVSLTYNPRTSAESEYYAKSAYLYDLLTPYFYDKSVFTGTIAVELDVSVTVDNGMAHYYAAVLSAFYSEQNGAAEGWDAKCLGSSADSLPQRNEEYRAQKSHVGYFDGSVSYSGNPSAVSLVSIPWDASYELEGHVVGPTDEGMASGYLFNIRNGETLDVAWAIFDDDRDESRSSDEGYANYFYQAREDHNENLFIILKDESDSTRRAGLVIEHDKIQAVSYGAATNTYEVIDGIGPVTRISYTGFISVKVLKGDDVDKYLNPQITSKPSGTTMIFPITKTLVLGDSRTGCPVDSSIQGYYEYRLTLDGMMNRAKTEENFSSTRENYFGIKRLFGDNVPRNISAMLSEVSTWEYKTSKGDTKAKDNLSNTYAARSIDDPVYLTKIAVNNTNGMLSYFYTVEEHSARYDGADDYEAYKDYDYVVTGTGVVNTFFGDKVYDTVNDSLGNTTYTGGTIWGSQREAVLTNCRHLYNIRWMASDAPVTFKIVSDINWYVHVGDLYTSEVKVFNRENNISSYTSPVGSDAQLKTVSFPAINELKEQWTLTSLSDAGSQTFFSINNIQLRAASFYKSNDVGYALICKNSGIIYNVYVNNLSLILTSVTDGAACDYMSDNSTFNPDTVTVTNGNSGLNNKPVGALVGINSGMIGSANESDELRNTVQVNNSIVMSGGYWKYGAHDYVGGVIGQNDGRDRGALSTFGKIEVGGTFVVLGKSYTGGIIGYNNADISARLVVDGSDDTFTGEFTLPVAAVTGERIRCAVISNITAGGAIGKTENGHKFITTDDTPRHSISDVDSVTGNITFEDPQYFMIDVTLPGGSLIQHLGINDNEAYIGGAIGHLKSCQGNYLSIRVNNSGKILSDNTRTSYVGGVIGREELSTTSDVYVKCINGSNSLIGSGSDDTSRGPRCAGGAYGQFYSIESNRTIAINVSNNGTIRSRGAEAGNGAGGAIGGTGGSISATFKINVTNGDSSNIIGIGSDASKYNGTGGAIGGMTEGSTFNTDTVIYAENYGTIKGVYFVGGAVGQLPLNRGKIYAVNYGSPEGETGGTITGKNFIGGAVGRCAKDNYGVIQSILSGTTITGENFIGGAAGRMLSFHDGANIKTIVRSSSVVSGTGSIIGGVCGDIRITDTGENMKIELVGDSSAPTLTIDGRFGDAVGGAAGILRANNVNYSNVVMPTQNDFDKLIVNVDGINDVGGAVGLLRSSNSDDNTPSKVINDSVTSQNINVKINVVLHPMSHIVGTGNNVGGAVGYINTSGGWFGGHIGVTSVYGTMAAGAAVIQGVYNVGGAVGNFCKSLPYYLDDNSGITVDFTAMPWTIEGTGAPKSVETAGTDVSTFNTVEKYGVGGVIGYIEGRKENSNSAQYLVIDARLGNSTVKSAGSNVGGVAGYNYNALGGTDLSAQLTVNGQILGVNNVGGVVGYNYREADNEAIHTVNAIVSGNITGTASDVAAVGRGCAVGGAIGYNQSRVGNVTSVINGWVQGEGDYVGGAIGYSYVTNNSQYEIDTVEATIQGDAHVVGKNDVGGAIGYNRNNINRVESNITGTSSVDGVSCVGGAIGFASAHPGQLGSDVLGGKSVGRIVIVKATISADYAISGETRIGGAVGQVGYKSNTYNSAALVYVEAVLNSAYLFDPNNTGTGDTIRESCVGGVVGIFVDGRLGVSGGGETGGVVLSGTGGVVHTDYPNRTYSNTVLVAASGCSIGGLVGEIGIDGYQQNVCLSNLYVKDDGPGLCVLSTNGGSRIGGWIGSGYAAHGGIGNNNEGEYNNAATQVTYNVNNVRSVVSLGGSDVGGFIGKLDAYNNNARGEVGTYANINVNLSEATITGSSAVGGVVGSARNAKFIRGNITVSLSDHTTIGDITGNRMPGDNSSYPLPICYDAGGAVGYMSSEKSQIELGIPVTVYIDSTSKIYAGADPEQLPTDINKEDYGVGGIFGRVDNLKDNRQNSNNTNSIRVVSEDPVITSVYSRSTNVGGAVGRLSRGQLDRAYALVSVGSGGDDIYVGGLIGRIDSRSYINPTVTSAITIQDCHFGPDSVVSAEGYFEDVFGEGANYNPAGYYVKADGRFAYAGGLIGGFTAQNNIAISKCYTTATVTAEQSAATGGFVGYVNSNGKSVTISNSYVSGHTYAGQYIANEGNITGAGYVGGFVGQINSSAKFTSCYSTASVYGNDNCTYAGGFIGYRESTASESVDSCYSTGRVLISNTNGKSGAFAGHYGTGSIKASWSLDGINDTQMPLIGDVEGSVNNLVYAVASAKSATSTYTAHPFDSTLIEKSPYTIVYNNEHWGDWPVPSNGNYSLGDVLITIDMSEDEYTYSPNGVTLDDKIIISYNDVPLQLNRDYILTYINNDRVGEAVVVISGIGDYKDVVTKNFTIVPAPITNAAVTVTTSEYEYTGAPIVPQDIKVVVDGTELTMNTDYYLTYDNNNNSAINDNDHTNIGLITVKVHGTRNYYGSAAGTVQFTIVGRSFENEGAVEVTLVNATPEELVYNGQPKEPRVIVRVDGRTLSTDEYSVGYDNNIDAGEATITITAVSASYSGSTNVHFTITQATNRILAEPSIGNWTWADTPATISGISTDFGTAVYSVYSEETCSDPDKLVVAAQDLASLNNSEALKNLDAGTYYLLAKVVETNNYTEASAIKPFVITPADITGVATVTPEYENIPYNGDSLIPSLTVEYNGRTLSAESDYNITVTPDSINPGVKTITVTGTGNTTGSVTATYEIQSVVTVTFDSAGGSDVPPQTVVYGTQITEPDPPVREGYRFDHWYKDVQAIVYNFAGTVNSSFTLHASWTKLYTVTFETGDADTKIVQYIPNGEFITRPEDPVKEGYVFDGWFADKDIWQNPLNNYNAAIGQDYTFYAKWIPQVHTVTFDTTGGNYIEPITVTYPEIPDLPTDPVKEGYVFDGWYTDSDCNISYQSGSPVPVDITLYAKWKES